jgi:SAM-dependent methyltransferase
MLRIESTPLSGYENLAPYYTVLFPVGEALKSFLEPYVRGCLDENQPWLDIGCGTGALVEWLLERGVDAWGLDPDRCFVEEARRRLGNQSRKIIEGGMLDYGDLPAMGGFGTITCLGNVLAHAIGMEEVSRFFKKSAANLREGGNAIVQTVNFDRVLRSVNWEFPIIERVTPDGARLGFERHYYREGWKEGEPLRFDTALCFGDDRIENSTWLFPVMETPLMEAAAPFFKKTRVFGDFNRNPWTEDSPATIVVGSN